MNQPTDKQTTNKQTNRQTDKQLLFLNDLKDIEKPKNII